MKLNKFAAVAALLFCVVLAAFAGFDQYNSKNYTTCLVPQYIADDSLIISNSAVTGVDIVGLPGNGCMVFGYRCTNAATAILKFEILSCATTNGSYAVVTNSAGQSSWSYTNAAGFGKVLFKPNAASRYLRIRVTPTEVTNGSASAVLVTE